MVGAGAGAGAGPGRAGATDALSPSDAAHIHPLMRIYSWLSRARRLTHDRGSTLSSGKQIRRFRAVQECPVLVRCLRCRIVGPSCLHRQTCAVCERLIAVR